MKKFSYSILFACAVSIAPLLASAAVSTFNFNTPLSYGSKGAEVIKLQQFLISQGFLSSEATGNYLSLTQAAVQSFQQAQGIETVGSFGPLTRAAANAKILATAKPAGKIATVTLQSIAPAMGNQAASLSSSEKVRVIEWQTLDYPKNVGVSINLLRKISNSPVSYSLVRKIGESMSNPGSYTWTPAAGETGRDLYIEVTCLASFKFQNGCQAKGLPIRAF